MAGFGSSEHASNPLLCANNCGFFGNPETRNLCSVCYNAFLKENLISNSNRIQVSESDAATNPSCSEPDSKATARKNRCRLCKTKVGLLRFKCRCGGLFCGKHRFQEEHGCTFDMKTVERDKLAKQNVEIKGEKLQNRV